MDPDESGSDSNGVVNVDYPLEPSNSVCQILDSSGGLLCVIDSFTNPAVWNPSTRHFNPLPNPSLLQDSEVLYGFTYDYSNDDYKILRLVFPHRDTVKTDFDFAFKTEIDIFELKTNRWRRVGETRFTRPAWTEGSFYNGAFYWVAWRIRDWYEDNTRVVASFDLTEERFKEVELPIHVGSINLKVSRRFLSVMYHDFLWRAYRDVGNG